MSDSNEIITDPRLEKRSRRHFSVAEKKRLLAEVDALAHGEKGAWLRRQGLYAGQLSSWRKDLAQHGEAGVGARQPGRKPADPRDKELERLKKANARLEKRAYVAEQLVDLQKIRRSRPHARGARRRIVESTECARCDAQKAGLESPAVWPQSVYNRNSLFLFGFSDLPSK